MRNTSIVAPSPTRVVNAQLNIRDEHLEFRKYPVNDGAVYTNGMWHDVCGWGDGFLRVATTLVSGSWKLWFQYAANPGDFSNPIEDTLGTWTDSGIVVYPRSTIGIFANRVFYQAINGNIEYADFDGSGFGTPVPVIAAFDGIVAIAPISTSEIYIQHKLLSTSEYSEIAHVTDVGVQTDWDGRLYGNMAFFSGFDAVRINGRDYIFFSDEDGKRTLYMTRIGEVWSDVLQLVPLDVVDDTSSFILGGAAEDIDGNLYVSGVLKRDQHFPMHIFMKEIAPGHFSLGREMFIRTGQTKEAVITLGGTDYIFPMPSGKLVLSSDILWYVSLGSVYYAYGTNYVGSDREEYQLQTTDFSSLKLGYATNQPAMFTAEVSTALDSAMLRPGCVVDVLMGYNNDMARIGRFDISLEQDGREQSGKTKTLIGNGHATKLLSQWEPDASYDYWSQTKVSTNPAEMTKLIRASGSWDDDNGAILEDLNVDGFLYSVDRQSRNQMVRARFQFPAATYYTPVFGVCLQYYGSTDLGKNCLAAVYDDGEIRLDLIRGGELANTLSMYEVTLDPDTWYWLQADFHDCHITVSLGEIGAGNAITWTRVIDTTYQSAEPPWVRDDFIGRGALYMKNETPNSMGFPFTSSEMIVPVHDNTDFPNGPDYVKVEDEIIQYQGKSYNVYQEDLIPALGDAIVGNVNEDGIVGWHKFAYDDGTQYSAVIQTFLLTANFFTNGVRMYVRKLEGETDDMVIAVYQGPRNEKRPVGVKICSARIANEDISESGSWVTSNFGTAMFLNKTNRYWIIASQAENAGDPTNPGFEVAYTTSPDVRGACYKFNEDADSWNTLAGDTLYALLGSTSVNAWTIILDGGSFTPPSDVAQYNDMALVVTSGTGQDEMFKVIGYGGQTDAGNYIVFVDRDPAGIIGDDTKFYLAPTLKVKTRGALSTEPTFHGAALVSLYRDKSPKCDLFHYYSSEQDMTIEDVVQELAAKAGVYAYSATRVPEEMSFAAPGQGPAVDTKNFIMRITPNAEAQPYIRFRASDLSLDGYTLSFVAGDMILKDEYTDVILDAVPHPGSLIDTPITISLFEDHLSVWIGGRFIHAFHLSDYGIEVGYGSMNAVCSSTACVLDVHWAQCDQLRDNYIFDMGTNGTSLLSDLIKERRIFFRDDEDGYLELLRDRETISDQGFYPLDFAVMASSNTNDTDFATRIRLVGGEIAEGLSRSALASYGNVFRLKYSQLLDYEEEVMEEALRGLVDATATMNSYSIVGPLYPQIEVNDVVYCVVNGNQAMNVVVDSIEISLAIADSEIFCDMQIECHKYIPYDSGRDIIIQSLVSPLDWSDGLEDPSPTGRKVLRITSSGVVVEYAATALGVQLALVASSAGDTVYVPAGTYTYASPTLLPVRNGMVFLGAGKTNTILDGTVGLQISPGAVVQDIGMTTSGYNYAYETNIYCAMYATGYSNVTNCRIDLDTTDDKHGVGYIQHAGRGFLKDVDIRAKASGSISIDEDATAHCVMNFDQLAAAGGEFYSSDLVIATGEVPDTNSTKKNVSITGAIVVEAGL